MKDFGVEVLVSVVGTRLCCEIGELYKMLEHMTGTSVFTHQLSRANEFCRPKLLELFPELRCVIDEEKKFIEKLRINERDKWMDLCKEHVKNLVKNYKLKLVYSVPEVEGFEVIDPVAELERMMND